MDEDFSLKGKNDDLPEKGSDVPSVCVGCLRWPRFGKNCWYYWEGKKRCTMWTNDIEELARADMFMQ